MKYLLLVLIIVSSYSSSIAQVVNPYTEEEKKALSIDVIQQAEALVEVDFDKSDFVINRDSTLVYLRLTGRVLHDFTGGLKKNDRIQVVDFFGWYENGRMPEVNNHSPVRLGNLGHMILPVSLLNCYDCNYNSGLPVYTIVNEDCTPIYVDESKGVKYYAGGLYQRLWETKDDLYNWLKQYRNIFLPKDVKQRAKLFEVEDEKDKKDGVKDKRIFKMPSGIGQIDFEIPSQGITYNTDFTLPDTDDAYYFFQVSIKDDVDQSSLESTSLFFKHRTSALGTNIADPTSGVDIVVKSPFFDMSNYTIDVLDVSGNDDVFEIRVTAQNSNRIIIGSNFLPFITVFVKISEEAGSGCDNNTGVRLRFTDDGTTLSQTTYFDANSSSLANYSSIDTDNPNDYKLCDESPTIIESSIDYNRTYIGGSQFPLDSRLTIQGINFGNKPASEGEVLFRNLSDLTNQNAFSKGIDRYYIESWSNNLIVVRIPAISFRKESLTTIGPSQAGSGQFKILNKYGKDVTSQGELKIYSSYLSLADKQHDALPLDRNQPGYVLLTKNGCTNGLVFTLHENIKNSPDKSDIINNVEQVLSDWKSFLSSVGYSITLEIERDPNTNDVIYTTAEPTTGKSVIKLVPGVFQRKPISGMATTSTFNRDFSDVLLHFNKNDKARAEASIVINEMQNWHYNVTGSVPFGSVDFYHAFAHEVGHAIGLDHAERLSSDAEFLENLMTRQISNQGVSSSDRVKIDASDTKAEYAEELADELIFEAQITGSWNDFLYEGFNDAIEKLDNSNSAIVVAPSITPPTGVGPKVTHITLCSSSPNNNYWYPTGETTQCVIASVCEAHKYKVKIQKSNCAESSPYSDPIAKYTTLCQQARPILNEIIIDNVVGDIILNPNPTTGLLSFNLAFSSNPVIGPSDIYVTNLYGEIIYNTTLPSGVNTLSYDLNNLNVPLENGYYWVLWYKNGNQLIDIESLSLFR